MSRESRRTLPWGALVGIALGLCALPAAAQEFYLANGGGNNILKIDALSQVTQLASGPEFDFPWGVALDRGGRLYVSSVGRNAILRISQKGIVTRFATGAGLDQPTGLAFDPKGYLYVANYYGNSLSRVTPRGRILPFARYHFPNGIVFWPQRKSGGGQ